MAGNYPDFNVTGQIGSNPITPIGENVMTQGIGFPLRPVSSAPGEPGLANILAAQNDNDQIPAGLGVTLQVSYGPPQANATVSLDANGTLTFLEDGAYLVITNLYFVRTTTPGVSIMFLRFLLDGVQSGNPVAIEMTENGTSQFQQFLLAGQVTAGTELSVEVIRDSAENNDGQLEAFTSTDGWGNAPSSIIRVLKF